jgi:hypothetical protein
MTEVANKKRKRAGSKVARRRNRRLKEKAALTVLAERYPAAFRLGGERLPLKIGIDRDLFAALDDTLARWRVRGALGFYTYGANYLRSLKEGAVRVDMQAAGITEQVMVTFTSDPYHPGDTMPTREVLQVLIEHGLGICTLTKGGTRALRDLDLFRPERDAFASTLTSLDDAFSKKWESEAALPGDRIEALKRFHAAGPRSGSASPPAGADGRCGGRTLAGATMGMARSGFGEREHHQRRPDLPEVSRRARAGGRCLPGMPLPRGRDHPQAKRTAPPCRGQGAASATAAPRHSRGQRRRTTR